MLQRSHEPKQEKRCRDRKGGDLLHGHIKPVADGSVDRTKVICKALQSLVYLSPEYFKSEVSLKYITCY